MSRANERSAPQTTHETERSHSTRNRLIAGIGGFLLSGAAVYAGYKGIAPNETVDVSLLVGGELGFVGAIKVGIPACFDIAEARKKRSEPQYRDPLFRPGDGTAMYEISRRNHEEMLAERGQSDPVLEAIEAERRLEQERMDALMRQYTEYWSKVGQEVDGNLGDFPDSPTQDDL